MKWRQNLNDGALSDVLGTMLLLGVTITIIAGLAFNMNHLFLSAESEESPTLRADIQVQPGGKVITILHKGGDEFEVAELKAQVDVNGSAYNISQVQWTDPARFRIGDWMNITLASPLPLSSKVDILLVSDAHRMVIGSTEWHTASSSAPAPTVSLISMSVFFSNGDNVAVVSTSTTLTLFADVEHPEGRKFIRSVSMDLRSLNGPAIHSMVDSGTESDPVPGDGIYTASFIVPSFIPLGNYTVWVTATAFNGSSSTSNATVTVALEKSGSTAVDDKVVTDKKVFANASWEIKKAEGGQNDLISIHLKLKTANEKEDHPTTGKSMYPKHATVYFKTFKPGDSGVAGPINYACFSKSNLTATFSWKDVPIANYDKDTKPFEYFFAITYSSDGSQPSTHNYHIYANTENGYFTLRPTDPEVKTVESTKGAYAATNCP